MIARMVDKQQNIPLEGGEKLKILHQQASSETTKCVFFAQVSRFSTSQSATALEPSGADGATVSAQPQPPGMNQPPRPGFAAQGPRDQRAPHPGGLQAGAGPKIGTVYVQSTKNNTICTLVDQGGMPVAWASAGSCGFKNARKSTPYAAQVGMLDAAPVSLPTGIMTLTAGGKIYQLHAKVE